MIEVGPDCSDRQAGDDEIVSAPETPAEFEKRCHELRYGEEWKAPSSYLGGNVRWYKVVGVDGRSFVGKKVETSPRGEVVTYGPLQCIDANGFDNQIGWGNTSDKCPKGERKYTIAGHRLRVARDERETQ